jgi:hypothetical protein
MDMRRLLHSVVAVGLLAAQQAHAQVQCSSPADQTIFDLEALKSELVVLATGCHDSVQYNAFIRRYQPELGQTEKEFDAYFKRRYGSSGQREHDAYITSLANSQADVGLKQGTDFCERNVALFTEVMALTSPSQLPDYAAGKDLIPAELGACAPAPTPAVVRRTAPARSRTHRQ